MNDYGVAVRVGTTAMWQVGLSMGPYNGQAAAFSRSMAGWEVLYFQGRATSAG